MKAITPRFILALITSFATQAISQSEPALTNTMPLSTERTSMWWRDGFPGIIPQARWHRSIRTGHFGFVLDTETLAIPHIGALSSDADDSGLYDLPPAELDLQMTVNGVTYHCENAEEWTRFTGPRLVESGRFFQRGDVTDLVFQSKEGTTLNGEMRLETAAWSDRLSLILAGRPGVMPIHPGDASFGRVRGGFGFDGNNTFVIPAEPALDTPAFTLTFWAFIPSDYQAGKTSPWLVCRGHNELTDGNFGIILRRGATPEVRMNLGGGRDNAHTLRPDVGSPLNLDSWNHLAMSYDGKTLQLYANGKVAAAMAIEKPKSPKALPITFGGRGDGFGDGYRFQGVIDEVRYYDRALTVEELRLHHNKPEQERPGLEPVKEWRFSEEHPASMSQLRGEWKEATMQVSLTASGQKLTQDWQLPPGQVWSEESQQVALSIDPLTFSKSKENPSITVEATEIAKNETRPVQFDRALGWHRINLDGIEPILPDGVPPPSNDAIERIKLTLKNPGDTDEIARLMFEKTSRGFRQRIGSPITGISAVLRDKDGNPTGIPVQLSKNWHNDPEGGVYAGQWFHGISQVSLPAKTAIELELTIAYGHWGGVPAASHAQLSLIGWGGNQRWDQSAIGSWGESICYDPEQTQANCTITDVRPLMVTSMGAEAQWSWTNNVGGGDIFRLFNAKGERVPHASMQAIYQRQGPCLTEATYSGRIGETITHRTTVSLSRTDDLIRGTYRIRMDVNAPTDFSRFVIFQMGADTYSSTGEKKFAYGDQSGLKEEWSTKWGEDVYRTDPKECIGKTPWISLHEAVPRENVKAGAVANRGVVVRVWKARLGGKDASPWIAERGLDLRSHLASTIDFVPPPGVTRLEPGDFVEATIEHITVPQFTKDYYGPNQELRNALTQHENTWKMIHREAKENARVVEVTTGNLKHRFPDIEIQTESDIAAFTLTGGLGYVPLTFSNLSSHSGYVLIIDGKPVNQSVHGNDFWQTDYDPTNGTWSQTYNVPVPDQTPRKIVFKALED